MFTQESGCIWTKTLKKRPSKMLPTKCTSPAPQALFCPLCECLFNDPVISTRCGHTFCRTCITEKTSSRGNVSNSVCPVDNIPFHRSDLVSNIALKGQIDDLEIHCQHGLTRVDSDDEFLLDKEGCSHAIKLGRRSEHEDKCPFALVPCPNSANYCGKFRRRDLDGHLETCPRYPCKYRNEGRGLDPWGFSQRKGSQGFHASSFIFIF